MNTKETLNKVRTLLGMEVKLEQMTLDNGAVLEAEVFEQGAEIFVVADEERVPAPVGEHKAEDNVVIVIEEEGVISEIKKAESEEEEAPVQEEEVVEEEMSTEAATPKKVVESVSKETFFSEIEKLRNEINELKLAKVEVEEVEEVSVELSSDEDVKGITHTPENKPQERELHLFSQNRKQTLKDRIFKTLNK
jgi:hypothetical protein